MSTETIGLYLTKTGIEAFRVLKTTWSDGKVTYRYNGKHGAGCGALDDIKKTISVTLTTRRGIQTVMAI
jgi:hypothetical protein